MQLHLEGSSIALDAVMLDLDGTLVNTLGDFSAALNGMLADLQLPGIAPEVIEHLVGKGTEHLLRSVLAHGGLDAAQVQAQYAQAWQRYEHHYLRINGQFAQVYPGVEEGLHTLAAAGLPLACLTNKPLAFAQPLLRAKGLEKYFQCVFGGDSFARKKPDPLPLLETCKALGTQPGRTLMVGDSSNDAQAARAAGCPVVLMTYGYNHGRPIAEEQPALVLDDLRQLVDSTGGLG